MCMNKMKRHLPFFPVLLMVGLLVISCKKEKTNIHSGSASCAYFQNAPPRFLLCPDSVKKDSTINIGVLYDNQVHCQVFNSLTANTNGMTTELILSTKIDSCNCQDQSGPQTPTYPFVSHIQGQHIIKIHVVDSLYYSDTISVY
jgi:hypothetical protein